MTATWTDTVALIRSDIDRLLAIVRATGLSGRARYWTLLAAPEGAGLALYRLAHYFYLKGWRRLASLLYRLNITLMGVDIHPAVRIGPGCLLVHPVGTVLFGTFGAQVSVYPRVIVAPQLHDCSIEDAPVIGDGVTLGAMCSVLGRVSVADRVTIAPGSLVDFSVADAGILLKCLPGAKVVASRRRSQPDTV